MRLPEEMQAALKRRAEVEDRSMHTAALGAVERGLAVEADREAVRRLGAKYAATHTDLLRRLGE
ncbi:Arc family DNA-binding protein [Streptomyces gobiensis]|uniref:Arc family DNA-binding protein n=1 Tax=Streptomyces gobiensis TaxID=2875706 RepID=UPI001E4C1C00|nr:Arc family DNA-binding protein [Streptomyces gobiensis]UGY91673.1 Arc family DNA-binding protein [Streptomyces gobiensis]